MTSMIESSQQFGARVLLAGIRLPPNYGSAYIAQFESMYADLANEYETMLVPFYMDGVIFQPGYMQADGIHPNAEGTRIVAETVYQFLLSYLP